MTHAGMILGTAAYMAPEQARGKVVDHRADIWAFGVVLFEMITGTRAFDGDEISDVLASVLKSDPKWTALPAAAPAALRRLIRRCLERDPKRRLQAIGEARIQIDDLIGGVPEESRPLRLRPPVPSSASRAVPWALALVGAGLAITTLLLWAPWRQPPPASPIRMSVELGAGTALAAGNLGAAAVLSPDGTMLAFVGQDHVRLLHASCSSVDSRRCGPPRSRARKPPPIRSTHPTVNGSRSLPGETEESRRHGWRGGDDYGRAELARRGVVGRRHDCVFGEPKRLVPRAVEWRRARTADHTRGRRGHASIPANPAWWSCTFSTRPTPLRTISTTPPSSCSRCRVARRRSCIEAGITAGIFRAVTSRTSTNKRCSPRRSISIGSRSRGRRCR